MLLHMCDQAENLDLVRENIVIDTSIQPQRISPNTADISSQNATSLLQPIKISTRIEKNPAWMNALLLKCLVLRHVQLWKLIVHLLQVLLPLLE